MSSMPKVADFESGKAFGDLCEERQREILKRLIQYELPVPLVAMPIFPEAHRLLCIAKPCDENRPVQMVTCDSLEDIFGILSRRNLHEFTWYHGRLPE